MNCLLTRLLAAASFALPLTCSAAGFTAGAEGWTTTLGGDQAWVATGGNGGGWLRVTDTTLDDFLLNAPTSWLGNWTGYLGGIFSFDALNANGVSADWSEFGQVTITGSAGSVMLDIAAAGNPPPDGLWHHYAATLTPQAGWTGTASLAAVLANVTSLTIKGEFHIGVAEVVGIDNIQVSAVPEPGSAGMVLAGLGLLAALRRKR